MSLDINLNTLLVSDTHFDHSNIVKFLNTKIKLVLLTIFSFLEIMIKRIEIIIFSMDLMRLLRVYGFIIRE